MQTKTKPDVELLDGMGWDGLNLMDEWEEEKREKNATEPMCTVCMVSITPPPPC